MLLLYAPYRRMTGDGSPFIFDRERAKMKSSKLLEAVLEEKRREIIK